MRSLIFLLILELPALAGSFSGAAGTPGSDAIPANSGLFVNWANGNLTPNYGTGVDAIWKTPAKAHGPAASNTADIVCLGNGGNITLTFPFPIREESGADFAVFENSFNDTFLELAFVEVSSDGANYFRFPNRSEGNVAVGAFGSVNPTTLNGLAGKHRVGFGTPFDLASLGSPGGLDLTRIRYVRIVDITGGGAVKDSIGHSIYDPTPTTGSGGFDLEAIGVIHQNTEPEFPVLSIGASPSNGGSISGGGTYANGSFAIVNASPAIGYAFSYWSTPSGNFTNPSYGFSIHFDTTLIAVFTVLNHTINASASPAFGGSVMGSGVYGNGASVTLTAIPASGYIFTGWTENGVLVNQNNPAIFTPNGSYNFVATFALEPSYQIVISSVGSTVTLTWPSAAVGWTLEESTDLITWTAFTQTITASGGENQVVLLNVTGSRFFRLAH